MLMNDYLIDCLDEYFEALDQMMDKLDQITQTQNREKEYRRMRKTSRGRMVGGGFGLSGALEIYPYYFDIYVVIWEDFADKTGDLRKMAEKFGVPLEEYIKKSTEEYCGRIFKKYCATYINSKNPVLESVRERKQLLIALVEMLKYCEKRKVSTQVSTINKCKEILKKADIRIKTVDGITYDSADEAEKIRIDQKNFMII